MKINSANIVTILSSKKFNWKQVEGLMCVHTLYNDYYINLCLYHSFGVEAIYVNVDDFKRQINDIVDTKFVSGSPGFSELYSIYIGALETSEKLVPEHQV